MPISSADPGLSPALSVQGLSAGYKGKPILHDVSVEVGQGTIAVVIGPNGAGKSTLLKAIMGVIECWSGTVRLHGDPVMQLRTDQLAKRGIAYVPQVRDVFDPLTLRENLEMGAYLLPKTDVASRIEEVLELFPPLVAMLKRRAGNLSGGERKMLAVARVLMNRPSVLLLDEPTAGLSPKLADSLLREHVMALAGRGVAIVLVEQRAKAALGIAHSGYVMVAGKVEVSGPAAELAEREDIAELFLGGSSRMADRRA